MDGLSSSVVILVAAVLWLVYLVPTWFKRREYLSTERNAVRLQQTLRIMAETAEVPEQIRVESSARTIAAQEKIMQREMQRTAAIRQAQEAADARAAARKLAEQRPAIAADVARSSASSRRLRRSRFISTVVLLAALVGAGFGVAQVAAGMGWVLLAASLLVAAGAVVLLGQLAAVSRARKQLAAGLTAPARVASPVRDMWEQPSGIEQARAAEWTPVPVPKPLYLSRPEAPVVAASVGAGVLAGSGSDSARTQANGPRDVAAELREAAAASELALRAAQAETSRIVPAASSGEAPAAVAASRAAASAPAASAAASQQAPSRFARMGVLDESDFAPTNLDEVLRRRRAV